MKKEQRDEKRGSSSRDFKLVSCFDDPQKENFLKIINHGRTGGSGYFVILPVDQGFEHGPGRSFEPNPPGYNPLYHVRLAIEGGCNAYAAPLGAIEAGIDEIKKHRLPVILKVNSHDLMMLDSQDPMPALTAWVDDAVRLNCEAVGFTIYPGSSQAREMYHQLKSLVADARKAGLIVVVWAYPRGSGLPSKEAETALDVVAYGVHIACQLGAHMIKCKPPSALVSLPENVKRNLYSQSLSDLAGRVKVVIEAAFMGRRIVIFSGGEKKESGEVLEEIRELKKGGSFGSIVGRNSFQRPFKDGVVLLRQIQDIYLQP